VTHPYISTGLSKHKFGIPMADAARVYEQAARYRHLPAEGGLPHLQMLDPQPDSRAVDRVLALAATLRAQGDPINHVDFGGGLGVAYPYGAENGGGIAAFVECLQARLRDSGLR